MSCLRTTVPFYRDRIGRFEAAQHGSIFLDEIGDLPLNVYRKTKLRKAPHKDPVDQTEMKKRQLIDALREANGNQSRAADILGVSRVTVWKRMKKFDVRFERGQVEY